MSETKAKHIGEPCIHPSVCLSINCLFITPSLDSKDIPPTSTSNVSASNGIPKLACSQLSVLRVNTVQVCAYCKVCASVCLRSFYSRKVNDTLKQLNLFPGARGCVYDSCALHQPSPPPSSSSSSSPASSSSSSSPTVRCQLLHVNHPRRDNCERQLFKRI